MRKWALVIALMGVAPSAADAAVVYADSFSYADGPLVGAVGSPWTTHSGTAGQVNVAGGQVVLTETESEDVSAPLSGAPYSTGMLYAGFDVTFTSLPSGTGNYFAHFKDATTSGFRGRIFATTTGAAAGTYRVGIADTTSTFAAIPTDLSLNTTYRLVESIDTATGRSALFLNPTTTETGATVATDATTPLAISTYAFRQSLATGNGIGGLTVDRLTVSTTFAEAVQAVPEPTCLAALPLVGLLATRRRRPA